MSAETEEDREMGWLQNVVTPRAFYLSIAALAAGFILGAWAGVGMVPDPALDVPTDENGPAILPVPPYLPGITVLAFILVGLLLSLAARHEEWVDEADDDSDEEAPDAGGESA